MISIKDNDAIDSPHGIRKLTVADIKQELIATGVEFSASLRKEKLLELLTNALSNEDEYAPEVPLIFGPSGSAIAV